MPWFILTIVGAMLAMDLLWWWRADRWVRDMPGRRGWRGAVAVFMGVQVASLIWMIFGRWLFGRGDEAMPTGLVIAVFVWHFLVLTVTVVLWALACLGWGVGRLFVRRPVPTTDDAAAGGETLSEPHGAGDATDPPPRPAERSGPDDPDAQNAPRLVHRLGVGTVLIPPKVDIDAEPKPIERRPLTRRQLLGAAAALAPPLLTLGATGWAVPQLSHFRLRRLDVPLAGLPPALDGLTIAHVTDTHVGRFTRGEVLDRIVAETNALRADLVLFTGDLINHSLADLPTALEMFRQLRGKYAVALCEGNHDLFEGRKVFEQSVKRAGETLLVNESTTVTVRGQRIQLLGLRWGSGLGAATRGNERSDGAIRHSMGELLGQLRSDSFPILLAHHPHAFDPAREAGIPLTLAGHTHGGQLMLTSRVGFGPWMYRYWSGLYQSPDRAAACVVSNGVGNWFPIRTNAPAEILHLTLRPV